MGRFFGAHESFDRDDDHGLGSSDRSFGVVIAGVLALLAATSWLRGNEHWIWWLLAALLFIGLALLRPRFLAPFNRVWMRLTLLLNAIVTPVVLFAVFYLSIVPIGLMMRLAGKDPLRLRLDPDAETYWIQRDPPGPPPGSLNNQY